MSGCMDWGNTSACGTIDLGLLQPDGLTETEKNTIKSGITAAADAFLTVQAKEGYEVPLAVSTYIVEFGGQREIIENGYPWGSNSFILNQSMIFAYAYNFTGEKKYADGVIKSMDYLMGRNPMVKCYVSGYGENPMRNSFHNYFCPQIDPLLPSVPPGFIAGGPNTGCQDPWPLAGKPNTVAAQKCYTDDAESWGSNEVRLCWNASLAWLTGYIDEVGPGLKDEPTASTIPSVIPSWNEKRCDIDKNGFVNIVDIMAVAAVYNTDSSNPRYVKEYDMNDDGAINIGYILIMVKYFNKAI